MPKPSEIFDTPEATGFSRVGGSEEVVKYFCNELAYRLTPSNEAMKVIRYARLELTELLTTKDQEKEEAVRAERDRIANELIAYSHESGEKNINIWHCAQILKTDNGNFEREYGQVAINNHTLPTDDK